MVKQATSEGIPPTAAPATTHHNVHHTADAPRPPLRIIRPIQLVLAIIILGLTAYVASLKACGATRYGVYCSSITFPQNNFMLFNALYTIIVTIYFIVATFKLNLHNSIASLVIDALGAIFWFAGFIALAVVVGAYSVIYDDTESAGFGVMIAVVVFGVVEWLLFVAALVLSALSLRSHHSTTATPCSSTQTRV